MSKLYGVSVGVGDSDLMTLKAVKILNFCEVIAGVGNIEEAIAYKIAKKNIEYADSKMKLSLDFPMTKDEKLLEIAHKKAAKQIMNLLDKGKDVAFIVIGDISIYSTFIYIYKILKSKLYEVEMISGVSSFCAAAASLNIPLVEKDEQLHIIPASYDLDFALSLKGTKIFMKSGKNFITLKEKLKEYDNLVYMVENCGFENEKKYIGLENIPDTSKYLSLIIVKDKI